MSEDLPKISVVSTLYNADKYLKDCFESILSQDYEDFELVAVINGVSSDLTEKIVLDYAKQDMRIKVVYNRKAVSSVGEGLELGLKEMTGEYFTIIDGDDILFPGALRELMDHAKRSDSDIVVGNILRISMDGAVCGEIGLPDFSSMSRNDYLEKSVWYMDFLYHGKLYNAELLREYDITYLPVLVGMDMLLHYQFVWHAKKITRCKNNVHGYRVNTSSTTRTMTLAKLQDSFSCYLFLDRLFEKEGFYTDEEIMCGFKSQGLILIAGCLLQGGKGFYKQYVHDIDDLIKGGVFRAEKVQKYLKGWPVYYFVLSIYRLNITIGNMFCFLLNQIRTSNFRFLIRKFNM
ncbi:MAG: glycosyltransferase [Chlorobium sp.]|uniref:glycosyltransferase family 2 protein n=1 Tax=Chlorobium sp. TaxID=1095 RepID=UPI0025B9E028|nr:glycosyltransferase family 2 protein [Chlorobium sp.]MCF8383437.1 glycosyltransferase [Chlorobium sp.]